MNVKRKAPNFVHYDGWEREEGNSKKHQLLELISIYKEGSLSEIQGTVLESFSNTGCFLRIKWPNFNTRVIFWLSSRLKLFRIRPSQPFLYIPSAPAVERYSLKFQRQPRFDKLTRNVLGRVLGFVLLASRIPTSNTHKYKYIESQIQTHWNTNTKL